MTIRREINEYLFHELGLDADADEGGVSDSWPFALEAVGSIQTPDGDVEVFRFTDGDEAYFATAGSVLDVFPTGGMGFEDLRLALGGRRWIAERDPVDLRTSLPSDPRVPAGHERRSAIERLGAAALPAASGIRIVEGLFLRRTGAYLALVAHAESPDGVVVVGTGVTPMPIGFPDASAHRRLGWSVGRMLEAGGILP